MASIMYDYIRETPEVLTHIIDERARICAEFVERFKDADIGTVYVIGSGTSYHAGVSAKLYLEETGDMAFLLEQRPYFDDGFAYRGEGERPQTSLGRTGTVLEHLLVQQVTAFFDVGDHGIIRLRDRLNQRFWERT